MNLEDSRPYRSPEAMLPGCELSVQCDVWALGCVFLEFICWYSGGTTSLKSFEDQRVTDYDLSPSFCCRDNSAYDGPARMKVKDSVTKVRSYHVTKLNCKANIQ